MEHQAHWGEGAEREGGKTGELAESHAGSLFHPLTSPLLRLAESAVEKKNCLKGSLKKAAGGSGQSGTNDYFPLSTKASHSHAWGESCFQKGVLLNTKIFMSFIGKWRIQLLLSVLS